jgi:phage head maturation protease
LESFIPPVEVQANARRALEVRASKPESQRGMLAVGLGRARDLSSGRPVSLDIIRRMSSFFARHAVDKKGETWDEMGPGWQAWMGWGGDAGQRWARRILSRYERRVSTARENGKEVNYDAHGVHVVPSRKGGKIDKAGPNDPQGAPPAQQGQPPAPQGQPPQQGQGQGKPQPPAAPPVPKLVEVSPGKFRDENSGKMYERELKVPDDKQTKQNELDTIKYLENSGLKEAHKALMSLSINATETVNQDTKQRLFRAGLIEVTPSGVAVTPFGQFFINIVQSNKNIAEKEQMMKMTLYGAELYRKKKSGVSQPQQKQIPNANPHYLQRNDGVSYLERAEGMNDTLRKSLSSFKDDVEGNGMALGQIRATRDKLEHLAQMMSGEKVGLEAWQKSKITSASDDISAVHDAIVYSYDDDDSDTKKMLIQKNQKENMILTEQIETPNFIKFASFEKASPEQRVVVGYASSERVDGQNDVVDSEALSQALGDYMQWANLREMHQPKAVGKVLSATPVRGTIQLKDGSKLTNPLRIVAQIIDSETWEKVKTGVLKGFSIGGKVLQALTQKMNGKEVRRITGLQLHEISLVDRPANPDARIILMKRDDSSSSDGAVTKVVKPATISKASQSDPSKLLPQMQQLRNQAEIEGDLEQAERYNEIISLMLEAMGVIPQGTTRETGEIESGEKNNANPLSNGQQPSMGDLGNEQGIPSGMPENMMSMDQVYAYNPSFQNTANVAYAQLADDLQKAGRMLSKSTEGQLDQIMQAIQFIVQQVQALKQANAPAPQAPNMGQDPNAVPQQPTGMPDLSAVPTSESPLPAESAQPNVQSTIVPQQPTSSMAPSPETMAMLRGIGNPVLARSQETGDLKKGDVDLESIEREIRAMEQMTENSAPPMESMEGTPAAVEKSEAPAAPASFDVDSIAKSLSNVIAQQLVGINQQMEQMQTVAKEQNASLFATVNPLTEAINETKASIAPLVEKMAALDPLKEKLDALATRMEALENSPADGVSPVLRGTAVSKTLGGSAAEQTLSKGANELDTIYKMLDEAKDPIVRTKLREQAAYLESKNLFRRN